MFVGAQRRCLHRGAVLRFSCVSFLVYGVGCLALDLDVGFRDSGFESRVSVLGFRVSSVGRSPAPESASTFEMERRVSLPLYLSLSYSLCITLAHARCYREDGRGAVCASILTRVGCLVSGFGCLVSGVGFDSLVSGFDFEFPVLGFGFGFRFRVSVSSSGFRVSVSSSGFRVSVSSSGFRVSVSISGFWVPGSSSRLRDSVSRSGFRFSN